MAHDLGMVLVEQRGLARERCVEQRLQRLVGGVGRGQAQARQQAAGRGVDDEERLARRVERDRVCGLRADARHREQRRSQRSRRHQAQALRVAFVLAGQEVEELPDPPRLDPERARGAQVRLQFGRRQGAQPGDVVQDTGCPEVVERPCGAAPRRVLDENRPQRYLERALPRPPTRRPLKCVQHIVDLGQGRSRTPRAHRETVSSREPDD